MKNVKLCYKIFSVLMFASIIFFAALSSQKVSAVTSDVVSPSDYDGAFKVYYCSPVSTAVGESGGTLNIITGDSFSSGTTSLVLYKQNGTDRVVSEITLEAGTSPSKLFMYGNFLFLYDINDNTGLDIYELQADGLSDKTFFGETRISGFIDFSVAGNSLFILKGNTVYKYDLLSLSQGGTPSYVGEYAFSSLYPIKITAMGDDSFLLSDLMAGTMLADTSLNQENIIDSLLLNSCFYNGLLYYYNDKVIYAYDISAKEVVNTLTLSTSERPLSGEIGFVSSIYACEIGIFVTDKENKKVVRLNADLSYGDFCLSSQSYDSGRFFSPEYVSVYGGSIVVCDKNRLQVIDENKSVKFETVLSFTPKQAFIDSEGILYINDGNQVFVGNIAGSFAETSLITADIPQEALIKDIKLSSAGKLYLLTDTAVYTVNADGGIEYLLEVSGGKKLSVNLKTKRIYVLTDDKILMFDKVFSPCGEIELGNSGYGEIETDFNEDIYLLSGNTNTSSAVVKLSGTAYGERSEYILNGIKSEGLGGLQFNFLTGEVYITSATAHAVYTLFKTDLNLALAGDVPRLTLTSNPERSDFDADCKVIEITEYPSTLFYPFCGDYVQEAFYPVNIAESGSSVQTISAGTAVLCVSETDGYYAVFYNGKLGFVIKDNTVSKQNTSLQMRAETIISADVYNIPYFIADGAGESFFIKFTIEKWEMVNVLSRLASYGENQIDWLYVEYNGNYGYINGTLVAEYKELSELSYTTGKTDMDGAAVYVKADGKEVTGEFIPSDADIKIYYKRGDYTYVSYTNRDGSEIKGYILTSLIAVDTSGQKRSLGFILLISAFVAAFIVLVVKRKYFS